MTSEVMEVVLTRIDHKLRFEDRKVILFLDNAPCHPDTPRNELSQTKLVFLPKYTKLRLQPLNAEIIRAFKCKYRKLLVKYIVSRVDEGKRASDIIQDVTILKVIQWLKASLRKLYNIASKSVDSKRRVAPVLSMVLMRISEYIPAIIM